MLGGNKVNSILLIPFILIVLSTTVNAGELYKCVDSNGNMVITSTPQDGMKCKVAESDEEQSSPKTASKSQNNQSGNLVDRCDNLYRESEEISDEIKSFDEHLSELQKEQFAIRQKSVSNNWSYKTESEKSKHVRDEQYKINKQISLLNQKKYLISNDIRMYKCDQIKQDLSKLNQGNVINSNPAYQKNRKGTVIIRNRVREIIIRN